MNDAQRKMEEDRLKCDLKPVEGSSATPSHVVQENALKRQPAPRILVVDDTHSVLDALRAQEAHLLEATLVNPPNHINCDPESLDFIKSFRLKVNGPRVGVTVTPKKP